MSNDEYKSKWDIRAWMVVAYLAAMVVAMVMHPIVVILLSIAPFAWIEYADRQLAKESKRADEALESGDQ